jgi:hypothetical protein
MLHRFGYMGGLHRIEVHRLAFIHRTKSAVPRACVTAEHKSRRLVGPALENIRALSFLANGVEIQPANQIEYGVLIPRVTELDLQPIRLLEACAIFAI